jgi:hypothetical protein
MRWEGQIGVEGKYRLVGEHVLGEWFEALDFL